MSLLFEFLNTQSFAGRPLMTWAAVLLTALCAVLLSWVLRHLVRDLLIRRFGRIGLEAGAFECPIRRSVRFVCAAVALNIVRELLRTDRPVDAAMERLVWSAYVLALSVVLYTLLPRVVDLLIRSRAAEQSERRRDTLARYAAVMIRLMVLLFGAFSVLSVWGINVSGVLAGVGIGGLAVSLAAKDMLSNLIGGLTIMADRPFEMGDLIRVGETEGTVEQIGFRSTRIRTAQTLLVIVPNGLIVNDQVVNISRLEQRRIRTELLLDPALTGARLTQLLDELRRLVSERPGIRPDQVCVRLTESGGDAHRILVQYFITDTRYDSMLIEQETLLLAVQRLLDERAVRRINPLAESLQTAVQGASGDGSK